jgi:hypothetical protein
MRQVQSSANFAPWRCVARFLDLIVLLQLCLNSVAEIQWIEQIDQSFVFKLGQSERKGVLSFPTITLIENNLNFSSLSLNLFDLNVNQRDGLPAMVDKNRGRNIDAVATH